MTTPQDNGAEHAQSPLADSALALLTNALERNPELAARIARALKLGREWIPVPELAAEIGAPERAITLAGKRGELEIVGPRCARVVHHTKIGPWLIACAAKKPKMKSAKVEPIDDPRAEARASVLAAAEAARQPAPNAARRRKSA